MGNRDHIPPPFPENGRNRGVSARGAEFVLRPQGAPEDCNLVPCILTPRKARDLAQLLMGVLDEGLSIPHILLDPSAIIYEIPDLRAVYMLTDVDRLGRGYAHIVVKDRALYRRPDIAHQALGIFFNQYHIHRITGLTPVTQPLAVRFAKRLGFVEEGLLRQAVCYNGAWVDAVVHGLLREEWEQASVEAEQNPSSDEKTD